MSTVIVHDTRLIGATPTALADASIEVDKNTPITGLADEIINAANSSISRLLIMCHGRPGHLLLCMEGLGRDNMDVLAPLNGYVEKIFLYACAVVGQGGATSAGEYFGERMAEVTGAHVFAADVTQWYRGHQTDQVNMVSELIPINFGGWEGDVYEFRPDASPILVISNPVSERHVF